MKVIHGFLFAVCFLLLCGLLVQNLALAATAAVGAGAYFFGGKMME